MIGSSFAFSKKQEIALLDNPAVAPGGFDNEREIQVENGGIIAYRFTVPDTFSLSKNWRCLTKMCRKATTEKLSFAEGSPVFCREKWPFPPPPLSVVRAIG